MVVKRCEEVGEDPKDDCCAAELDDSEEPGDGFESESTTASHFV